MVSDVSAMFVASTTLRVPRGVTSNTRICSSLGIAANNSTTFSAGIPSGWCPDRARSSRPRDSISSCPVRNTRMSPAGSSSLI